MLIFNPWRRIPFVDIKLELIRYGILKSDSMNKYDGIYLFFSF